MTNLGAVCNFEYANPADDTAASVAAAGRYDAIYNRFSWVVFFINPIPIWC